VLSVGAQVPTPGTVQSELMSFIFMSLEGTK